MKKLSDLPAFLRVLSKRRIIIIVSLSAVLSAYVSLVLKSLQCASFTTDPLLLIRLCLDSGFPSGTFAVLLLLIFSFLFFFMVGSKDKGTFHPIDGNRHLSDRDNYGRADFEKPSQYSSLARIRPDFECTGHIYGMLDRAGRRCIDFDPDPDDPESHLNSHIFAIGASGSGKTFTVGKTYCFQSMKMGHSVIHTDPKGELYSDMADIYHRHGYIVRRLNFISPERSDGWDCMKTLCNEKDPVKVGIQAQVFAAAVVSQIYTDTNSVYYNGGLMLLKAVLLRIVLDPSIPRKKKNIKTVYAYLTNPSGIDFLNSVFDPASVPREAVPCLAPWSTFKGASANLSGNILINLASGITVLSSGIVADILSTDDIDLLLPAQEKCAYFIQFPVPNSAFCFPVALFFSMLFDSLVNFASAQPGHCLPRTVDCMLDEFAQCGVFPYWDQRMSVFRAYKINVFMIVQTISQFTHLYKDTQDTIISNCATWLMLGTNDLSSARMFSDRIGQTTIEVESRSESKNGFLFLRTAFGSRVSVGTGRTSLLSPDEIMKLPVNTLLIVFQRHNPIWANAYPNTMHPFYIKVSSRSDLFEHFFYDRDNIADGIRTRAERRKLEMNYLDSYSEPEYVHIRNKTSIGRIQFPFLKSESNDKKKHKDISNQSYSDNNFGIPQSSRCSSIHTISDPVCLTDTSELSDKFMFDAEIDEGLKTQICSPPLPCSKKIESKNLIQPVSITYNLPQTAPPKTLKISLPDVSVFVNPADEHERSAPPSKKS